MKINLVIGDITGFDGDALVNAANPPLLGGGGVDGAIHRAAGYTLMEACEQIPFARGLEADKTRCPVGFVRPILAGPQLKVDWVFATVGPIWDAVAAERIMGDKARTRAHLRSMYTWGRQQPTEGQAWEWTLRDTLRGCYLGPAQLATAMGLTRIAYPAISAGVYGCPMLTVAQVAIQAFA
ncbi:MAG: macro domain-containing protein, partial [Dehalococcoidia bacterium]|nr:macro domain-containing protein [Dehalococcoidia bacterium]